MKKLQQDLGYFDFIKLRGGISQMNKWSFKAQRRTQHTIYFLAGSHNSASSENKSLV